MAVLMGPPYPVDLACGGDEGRVIVKLQDAADIILEPGQSTVVWFGKDQRFWKQRPTWWHRMRQGWRYLVSGERWRGERESRKHRRELEAKLRAALERNKDGS